MTNYLTGTNRWGEAVFDMARFAADLAAELGGTVIEDPERRDCNTIEVDGVRAWLATKGYGAGAYAKVHVHAMRPADGLAYNDHPYGKEYKLPDAWVTATRPMPAIAKDVRRRVIEPAKTPLAKWREHGAAVRRRGADLVARAAWLRGLGLAVRLDNGATRTGNFHGAVSGEFYADGAVNIRHLNLDAATFERVVRAIDANGKED